MMLIATFTAFSASAALVSGLMESPAFFWCARIVANASSACDVLSIFMFSTSPDGENVPTSPDGGGCLS